MWTKFKRLEHFLKLQNIFKFMKQNLEIGTFFQIPRTYFEFANKLSKTWFLFKLVNTFIEKFQIEKKTKKRQIRTFFKKGTFFKSHNILFKMRTFFEFMNNFGKCGNLLKKWRFFESGNNFLRLRTIFETWTFFKKICKIKKKRKKKPKRKQEHF